MKKRVKINIAALSILAIGAGGYFVLQEDILFSNLVYSCKQIIRSSNKPGPKVFKKLEKTRKDFLNKFNKPVELLAKLEQGKHKHQFSNSTKEAVIVKNPDLFPHMDKITKDIGIETKDSDAVKAEKIYNYFKAHFKKKYPLYSSPELHNPVTFFSTYGSGRCDDTARNLAMLAKHYGLNSSVLSLNGHLVCSIAYDNENRIFDPHTLGLTKEDGKVIGYKRFVELAQQEHFEAFNQEIASTEDNKFRPPEEFKIPGINFSFVAEENKSFFEDLYIVDASTPLAENHIITRHFKKRSQFFDYYGDVVANFTSEIPVKYLSNNAKLASSFPILAAYVQIPKGKAKKIATNKLPYSVVEPNIIYKDPTQGAIRVLAAQKFNASHLEPAEKLSSGKLTHDYLDISAGLNRLFFPGPSRRVRVANLEPIKILYPEAKLILVQLYAKNNVDFTAASSLPEEITRSPSS